MQKKPDELREWIKAFALGGDSPIEKMFLGALLLIISHSRHVEGDDWTGTIEIVPQHPVESFRVDVALISGNQRVAVECDGHEFHEKTKEQAAHDKARDRAIVAAGYTILRFTGSEIWRNPFACADEAIAHLRDKVAEEAWISYQAAQSAASLTGSEG